MSPFTKIDRPKAALRRRGETASGAPAAGTLQAALLHAATSNRRLDGLLEDLHRLLAVHGNVRSSIYFARTSSEQLQRVWQSANTKAAFAHEAANLALEAAASGKRQWRQADDDCLLVVPVLLRNQPPEALALQLYVKQGHANDTDFLAQAVATHVTLWNLLASEPQLKSLAARSRAVVGIIERVQAEDEFDAAAQLLVNQLQQALSCETVALGVRHPNESRCKLAAISGVAKIDVHSEMARDIDTALDECLAHKERLLWPPTSLEDPQAVSLKRVAHQTSAACVVGIPLAANGQEPSAVLVLSGDDGFRQSPAALEFLSAASTVLGGTVNLLARAHGTRWQRQARRLSKIGMRPLLAAMTILAGTLLIPLPYRVACDANLEPVSRRFLAAPFAGTLEKTLVEPGDLVEQGQTLARMDGREIRLERAAVLARYEQAEKQLDTALAKGEGTDAKLARLEMQKLSAELKLLDRREEHLEIRSPLSGVVVSGDLRRVEGAPLTVGQSLFEIAPTGEMIVELAIPESEIAYVRPAQEVTVKVSSYPGKAWFATIESIHPRAEIINGKNVFIAELRLSNENELLRPGMSGRAKISTDPHLLGWNLFHRAWESVAAKTGW